MNACEFLGGGEVLPDPQWRMPAHRHGSHHELILVLSGAMLLKTPREDYLARRGDLLFYQAGLVHEEISEPNDPVNILFVAFRIGKLLPSFPIHMRDADGRVRQLLSWLIRDRSQGRPIRECLSLVQAIVAELQWLCSSPRDPWLEDVLTFMRQNFADTLSLVDLARQARMSRFAFIRKFKRLAGRTPMEELRLIRLSEARNLILSSGLPLKSVAPAVGLGDEYQLSKLFRRHFGLSPREIRTRSASTTRANAKKGATGM